MNPTPGKGTAGSRGERESSMRLKPLGWPKIYKCEIYRSAKEEI